MVVVLAPGGFAVTAYPDEAALRDAIRDRNAYGDLVLAAGGPALLTATGASPVVAQLLTQISTGLAAHTGATLRTEDLAPLPSPTPPCCARRPTSPEPVRRQRSSC
jgi:hypothetical protein